MGQFTLRWVLAATMCTTYGLDSLKADEPISDVDTVVCDTDLDDCDNLAGCDELPGELGVPEPSEAGLFDYDVVYTSDSLLNTRGGVKTGGVYNGLLDLVLRTNLGEAGTFVLHGQNNHGPIFQQYTGATQSTNIDANPFTAMAEYYWVGGYDDDNAVFRVGRQVGAIQFSVLDLAADFTYGAFQKSPNNPVPWYPNPAFGGTADLFLTDNFEVVLGSFAGGPPNQMTSWGFSKDGSVYSVAEAKYHYLLEGLPGDIQNGFWYTSGTHDAVVGGAQYSGNYGIYAGWDQMLFSERCNADQGLGTFLIYSWAPNDRNTIENHVATGIVYRGLLRNRDADVSGIGVSIADFSGDLANLNTETTVEVFHKFALRNAAIVEPTLQHFSSPGGQFNDALAVGMRIGFEL